MINVTIKMKKIKKKPSNSIANSENSQSKLMLSSRRDEKRRSGEKGRTTSKCMVRCEKQDHKKNEGEHFRNRKRDR